MQINPMQCCGMRELSSLSAHNGNSEKALLSFGESTYFFRREKVIAKDGFNLERRVVDDPQVKFRYAIFTQAGRDQAGYGFKFAAFIRENRLGDVLETPFYNNPNSGNDVKVWIWAINHDNTKKLVTELKGKQFQDATARKVT